MVQGKKKTNLKLEKCVIFSHLFQGEPGFLGPQGEPGLPGLPGTKVGDISCLEKKHQSDKALDGFSLCLACLRQLQPKKDIFCVSLFKVSTSSLLLVSSYLKEKSTKVFFLTEQC